jgi:hypothetical protein
MMSLEISSSSNTRCYTISPSVMHLLSSLQLCCMSQVYPLFETLGKLPLATLNLHKNDLTRFVVQLEYYCSVHTISIRKSKDERQHVRSISDNEAPCSG